ncbi:MAG: YodL domain-containing protein [Acetatifactor sp.]
MGQKKDIYVDDLDGILHYFGNPAGYIDGDKVVVDSIFDKQDLVDYIENEVGKRVETKDGVFSGLVDGKFRYGPDVPIKNLSIRIYQLIPEGHLPKQFVSLYERREKGFGEPTRDEYKLTYEGQIEKFDLEDIWDRFSRFINRDERAHALAISDIVELTDGVNSRCFYIDTYGFAEISF